MTPEDLQFRFNSQLCSQTAWRMKADQLMKAGLLILDAAAVAQASCKPLFEGGSRELSPAEMRGFFNFLQYDVGFYLVSLSIENLLKAIWMGRHHNETNGISNVPLHLEGFYVHDLNKLASDAGLILDQGETELLDALKELILWFGRYPTPKTVNDYAKMFKFGTPVTRIAKITNIIDIELPLPESLRHVIQRLQRELGSIPV